MIIKPLKFLKKFSQVILFTAITLIYLFSFIYSPTAHAEMSGQELFTMHCSGCHIQGGNIIRRSKNLKLKALKRNGFDNQEAIARIARKGIGSMSGYEEVLGKGGDDLVAKWIWEQAQKAWVQG